MKKSLLLFVALAGLLLFSEPVRAQMASDLTFSFSPSSQIVAPGTSSNVSVSLVGTNPPPPNVTAYDLYLVTADTNSTFFTITGSDATGSTYSAFGPSTLPSPISTAAATGFVRNDENLGYSGSAQTPPHNDFLQTITISVDPSTPVGTYTFFSSTQANAGGFFSGASSNEPEQYIINEGSFQITVPEPSTWGLLLLGAAGLAGYARLRQRKS